MDSEQKTNPTAESNTGTPRATDSVAASSTSDLPAPHQNASRPDKAAVEQLLRAAAGVPPSKRETPVATPGEAAKTTPAARNNLGATKSAAPSSASVARSAPKAVAARPPAALVESTPDPPVNKMRRRIVWASVGGFLVTCFLMFLRFFLPRAIYEPASTFRIGFPGDYALGVDTKYQQEYRIWVDKTSDRLFVIYARCTHLGCTPDWKSSENKFKCPCHGSGYDNEGVNFEGPAPRPMDRAEVKLDPEGQIVVNVAKLYKWPKGEKSEFDQPGAYIPL